MDKECSWWAEPSGKYVLPEYIVGLREVCIHPLMMGTSPCEKNILTGGTCWCQQEKFKRGRSLREDCDESLWVIQ